MEILHRSSLASVEIDVRVRIGPLNRENTRRFRRLMGTPFVSTPVPTLGGRCRGACVRQQFSPA